MFTAEERRSQQLAGLIRDLFEVAEDFADMFQPFARASDHYGSLPRIHDEVCLHTREGGGLPQITECLFNEAGGPLEKFERPLLHSGGHAVRVARSVTHRTANGVSLHGIELVHAIQKSVDSLLGRLRGICQGCQRTDLKAGHHAVKDRFEQAALRWEMMGELAGAGISGVRKICHCCRSKAFSEHHRGACLDDLFAGNFSFVVSHNCESL